MRTTRAHIRQRLRPRRTTAKRITTARAENEALAKAAKLTTKKTAKSKKT